jgi:dihydrofolate reductase
MIETRGPFCSVFMALSQDGFMARPDGALDWLDEANRLVPLGEDCGFADFMARVDALVMGRKTFDTVRSMGVWPYGDKPVVVLSRRLKSLPEGVPGSVRLDGGDPQEVLERTSALGWQRLYIDGGETVQGFLKAGRVHELVLTEVPCLLGQGIALFDPAGLPAGFQCQRQHAYPFGFVQRQYLLQANQQDLMVRKALP